MSFDTIPDFHCVLVESRDGSGLMIREAGEKQVRNELSGYLCICRIKSWKKSASFEGQLYQPEPEDILFYDDWELLCRQNIRGSAEVLCLDPQIFSACNCGLFGERALTFFQYLAATHYCHKRDMAKHPALNELWQMIWDQRSPESPAVTEAIMGALWSMSALLKGQTAPKVPEPFKMDGRNKTRLMPLLFYLQDNYASKITLVNMAKMVNMSVPNFSAVFRKTMGMPPVEFLIRLRIQNASFQLVNTDKKIIDIAQDCGFTSISNFIKAFRRQYGISPVQFRTRDAG